MVIESKRFTGEIPCGDGTYFVYTGQQIGHKTIDDTRHSLISMPWLDCEIKPDLNYSDFLYALGYTKNDPSFKEWSRQHNLHKRRIKLSMEL